MQGVFPAVRYLRMNGLHTLNLLGPLCHRQFDLSPAIQALRHYLFTVGQGGKVF